MASRKINPFSTTNPDTGFGTQPSQVGGRFINKDGSFNLRSEGWSPLQRFSIYSRLLKLSSLQFLLIIFGFFFLINIFFTCLYFLAGPDQLHGIIATTPWQRVKEIFFYSTQTFTTVGYGRINPVKDTADLIASIESLTGLLSFAVITGLLYGRFSRPKAFIAFSENALISPFKEGQALMFRMVPYKSEHMLTNAQVTVNISLIVSEDGKQEYKFFQLNLERNRIDSFTMNWTVVHPIGEDSPLLNFTREDLEQTDMEVYVLVTGFDQVYSNTVMQRTSYRYNELVWGAKFLPMYRESEDGNTTILELNKLNAYHVLPVGEGHQGGV